MAKEIGGDEKTAGKRAKRQPADSQESGVLSMTKEGAGKPVAVVRRWYQVSEQFLREVRTELKKVTWPGRKETLASTGVVLIIVFFVAAYLGLVDLALSRLVGALLR